LNRPEATLQECQDCLDFVIDAALRLQEAEPESDFRSLPLRPTRVHGVGEVRSSNHFIRPRQHRRRDREPEGLGGLEVDD
jgi:hypothetical protein